jgi:peptidoglycan hydrolase FlgJ
MMSVAPSPFPGSADLQAPATPQIPVVRPSTPSDPAKVWKAAQDFEGMVLGEFLKPMFETTESKNPLFGGGEAEKTWKPMMVSEIGKQMAAAGGLGLASSIHDAMLKMQGEKS